MNTLKATIFNIQKFSINDGPGIRTTVFFKGCPLHCPWCSNPESQLKRPQFEWNRSACSECGHCLHCSGAITHAQVQALDATSPLAAELVKECPGKALSISGSWRTLDQFLDVCLQDEPFYEESGGGVTFSGGEALLWPDFVCALADALHAHGVSTCIETTGYASAEVFNRVVEKLDCVLIDMKHWDCMQHKRVIGVDNNVILSNMQHAIDLGKEVLVRIPVIPGFNDSPEDADGFARTLQQVGATRVQLLPFHQFGENKYQLLGKSYAMQGVAALHPEDLDAFVAMLQAQGIDAFI